MFTGLIEETGTVLRAERRGNVQRTETAASRPFLDSLNVGDRVNIDGACQTVVQCGPEGFAFESVEETLRRTTIRDLKPGGRVNLERSLRLGDRMGGHLVLGHVDGVGRIAGRKDASSDSLFRVDVPDGLERYIAEKGSVAVDGISLTVVEVKGRSFTVAIIPHTLQNTTLSLRGPGDSVNIEVDLMARYIERLMDWASSSKGHLTEGRLREMGYGGGRPTLGL